MNWEVFLCGNTLLEKNSWQSAGGRGARIGGRSTYKSIIKRKDAIW